MSTKLTTEEIQKLLDNVSLSNGDDTAEILFDNHNEFGYPDCIDSFIDYDSESNKIIIFHQIEYGEDVSSYYSIDINTASEYESIISMPTEELNQFVIDNSTYTKHFDFSGLQDKINSFNEMYVNGNVNESEEEDDEEMHDRIMSNMSEGERRQYQQFLDNSY